MGQQRICRVSARPIHRKARCWAIGTASDITDEVAAHAQIQHLSLHDALTGLPNRNKLARFLDEVLAQKEHSAALALLMIDLDNSGGNDRAVVQAIINLGKAMGLTVTAEGVETLEKWTS